MQSIRWVSAIVVVAWGLGASAARAVEFWDPAQCLETMIDHVEHLEEDVDDIGELKVLLDAAQRKGETANVAHFETVLESKRVDGIQSMLKRIDEVEYVYCDKSLFDPSLIARVDAARPFAEAGEAVVAAVEEPVDLQVAGVTSTFVPYETIETGGCRGPFIDLSITITNRAAPSPAPSISRSGSASIPAPTWPFSRSTSSSTGTTGWSAASRRSPSTRAC